MESMFGFSCLNMAIVERIRCWRNGHIAEWFTDFRGENMNLNLNLLKNTSNARFCENVAKKLFHRR